MNEIKKSDFFLFLWFCSGVVFLSTFHSVGKKKTRIAEKIKEKAPISIFIKKYSQYGRNNYDSLWIIGALFLPAAQI